MPTRNSGGVISRGYGLFSRVITRGFGRFFKTESFKPRKKKEPILREFTFEIYNPISKELDIEKNIKVPFIKELILKYFLKSNVRKLLEESYQINNNINKNLEYTYPLTFKIDKQKLINTLNILLEDD